MVIFFLRSIRPDNLHQVTKALKSNPFPEGVALSLDIFIRIGTSSAFIEVKK